jgi:acyl-CoA thioesterase FadM
MEVRFTDVDSQNHVNHLKILEWVAHERVKLFDRALLEAGWIETLDHVLVSITAEFKLEIFYPGDIEILSYVDKIGGSSVHTGYKVMYWDKVAATVSCINVFLTEDGLPIQVDERLRGELNIA